MEDLSVPQGENQPKLGRQMLLYFFFAILMIGLNILIQNLFELHFFPWLDNEYGEIPFFKNYIFKVNPYDIPELIGSIIWCRFQDNRGSRRVFLQGNLAVDLHRFVT